MAPVTKLIPKDLDELISYAFPDALWISYDPYSPDAGVVGVLDLDYSMSQWLASLSLDDRWTLSPIVDPTYSVENKRLF